MSIAEQSILPPVMPAGLCDAAPRPSSIRLGSRIVTRAIQAAIAPAAPSALAAAVSGPTVVLTWTAPAGGDPPTSYVLEAGSASGLTDLANSDTGTTTPALTATNVPPGTYYVRVRARNASGTSAPSNEIVVTVAGACATIPGAPTGLSSAVNGSSVTLTWQAPVGGCAPTSYFIEAGSSPGLSNLAAFSTGSASTSYQASGVGAGTYYVRVRSVNAAGTSGPSNEVQLTVGGCSAAPSAPSALSAQVSGSSVVLFWAASAGSPASYIVEAGSSPGSSDIVVSDTGSLATTLSATAAPATYYVRIRARNACGQSAPSNEIIVVVTPVTTCVAISPTSQTVGDTAVIGSVAVTAPASCTWTAVSNASFITITSGSSGAGSGTVSYNVAANTTGSVRTGTLTIGGQTFTITQQVCTFTSSPPVLFAAEGGVSTVAITTSSGCSWTAQSDASFVAITSAASGTGSGSISINVPANTGVVRGATLTIGQVFQSTTTKVVQTGPAGSASCVISMGSCLSGCTSATFGGNGGTLELNLAAPNTCSWIAAPSASWVEVYPAPTVQNTPYGIGSGHFGFRVAANSADTPRSGSIVAGGYTFPITQSACSFAVSPTSATVLASGGTGVITVTTSCTSTWTATSNAPFMTITSGSSGTGNGSVTVTIAANSGAARSGTLTIAGQTVTITQSAP
jgi:hypothetical protein